MESIDIVGTLQGLLPGLSHEKRNYHTWLACELLRVTCLCVSPHCVCIFPRSNSFLHANFSLMKWRILRIVTSVLLIYGLAMSLRSQVLSIFLLSCSRVWSPKGWRNSRYPLPVMLPEDSRGSISLCGSLSGCRVLPLLSLARLSSHAFS